MDVNNWLEEAKSLQYSSGDDLVKRVRQLRTNLRGASGLTLLQPDYHRAVKIYNEKVIPEFIWALEPEESNRIPYNQDLAALPT